MPEHDAHGQGEHQVLDDIVRELDPIETGKSVNLPHNKARESWDTPDEPVTDYNAFVQHITRYVQHHQKSVYKSQDATIPDATAFGEAMAILGQALKDQGGFKHAFKLAKEGRLAEVVDILATALREQALEQHKGYVINSKIDQGDTEAHTKLVKDIFGRLTGVIPGVELKDPMMFSDKYLGVLDGYLNNMRLIRDVYARPAANHDHEQQGGHAAHGGH